MQSLQRSESWKAASPGDAVAVKTGEVDIVVQVEWRLYKCDNGERRIWKVVVTVNYIGQSIHSSGLVYSL